MSVSSKGIPQIESVGPFVCVVSDHDLLVFGNESQPLWQTSLAASPRLVAANSNVLAVAAGNSVVAFNAKTADRNGLATISNQAVLSVGHGRRRLCNHQAVEERFHGERGEEVSPPTTFSRKDRPIRGRRSST